MSPALPDLRQSAYFAMVSLIRNVAIHFSRRLGGRRKAEYRER
jgi:hypothetical protein